MPAPDVLYEEEEGERPDILYSGLNLTLRCDVTLSHFSVSFVTLSIQWLKNGHSLQQCSELIRDSNTSYYCLLTLTHVSYKTDNGSYSCKAEVTPTADYPLLRSNSVTSNTLDYNVAGKNCNLAYPSSLFLSPSLHLPPSLPPFPPSLPLSLSLSLSSSCSECENDKSHHSSVGCSTIQCV